MVYKEFLPSSPLIPYIESYWTACGFQGSEEQYRILPDGCVDIIISLNASAHFGLIPFKPTIIGAMTTFGYGSYVDAVSLVGIRFRPVGFTAFCQVPIDEFTDRQIDLTAVDSLFDERFYACLPEKKSMEEVIRHVDSYFTEKLNRVFALDARMVRAVDLMRQSDGRLSLNEVAERSCLSLRHFERKFKAAVGFSPKSFNKIAKFQHTCHYLESNNEAALFEVAVDCGYYDQAHLIKDFKALSGRAPSYFKRNRE